MFPLLPSAASTFVLAVPVGSTLSLCLNGILGRLTLVKSIAIPYCIGWSLIASAASFEQLLIGRICTGTAIGKHTVHGDAGRLPIAEGNGNDINRKGFSFFENLKLFV